MINAVSSCDILSSVVAQQLQYSNLRSLTAAMQSVVSRCVAAQVSVTQALLALNHGSPKHVPENLHELRILFIIGRITFHLCLIGRS